MTGRPVRRVVLAEVDGASRVVADGAAPQRSERLSSVWGFASAPPLPNDGAEPELASLFPPPGGVRFIVVDFAADAPSDNGSPHAGHHRTDSYDCGAVLSGSVVCVLDDGEVALTAGDTFVQCGGAHTWENRSGAPCRVAFFLAGADRRV